METQKIVILSLVFLISLVAVVHAQNSTIARGGYITPMNITSSSETEHWQGFPGRLRIITPTGPPDVNATGGNVNRTVINITAPCTNPTSIRGFILFSNSSVPPAGLVPGNLTLLDNWIGPSAVSDSGTNTFRNTTNYNILGGAVNNVPTTWSNTFCAHQSSVFRQGYFNDANGNIVIGVEVDFNTPGYNSSLFDFQAVIPVFNRTTTRYYLTTDLDITCPARRFAGGGGGYRGGCLLNWTCTEWSHCENGLQTRKCYPISNCRVVLGIFPPETRLCKDEIAAPAIVDETDVRDYLLRSSPLLDIPAENIAYVGEWNQFPVQITNQNAESLENLSMAIQLPVFGQSFMPLHTEPRYYKKFGMITAGELKKKTEWNQLSEHFRLNPGSSRQPRFELRAPMITPRTLKGNIQAKSGSMSIAEKEADVIIDTKPFVVMQDKAGRGTQVQILIDNRQEEAKTASVELNFNKGRSTLFTEVYTLDVPADTVAIYGYEYGPLFDYEYIRARYEGHIAEAR